MATYIYWTGVALLFVILASIGVSDYGLYLNGGSAATISDWLRLHPGCFWWPVGIALVGLVVLIIHLFVYPLY